jgi:hypothetical protein
MVRLWLAMVVGLACLVVSGIVASMATAQSTADPTSVIAAYEMARNRHDVDGALSYFADDAVISQRNTTFSGKDEIRRYLDATSSRSRFAVVSDRRAVGNRVTWTERAGGFGGGEPQVRAPNGVAQAVGTAFTINVEAVVQDGKIRSLAYAFGGQVLRSDPALEGRAELPATVGLGAVMLVLLGLLLLASTTLRGSRNKASTLHGRLLPGLQGWSAARQ